jgi:hypothetical protein
LVENKSEYTKHLEEIDAVEAQMYAKTNLLNEMHSSLDENDTHQIETHTHTRT